MVSLCVEQCRAQFLDALRSGQYSKGPIETDAHGRPRDPTAEGWCAVGLAYTLFTDPRLHASPVHYRTALGLSRAQITHIQQVWNDSPLTFREIADRVEHELFGQH